MSLMNFTQNVSGSGGLVRRRGAEWSGPYDFWFLKLKTHTVLYACVFEGQAVDPFSYGCLLVSDQKVIIKPQSRSHNTRRFYKRKKYFVLKSLLHVIIFATVRLSTDASNTEMANMKKKKPKQSKIKPWRKSRNKTPRVSSPCPPLPPRPYNNCTIL